MRLSRKTRAGFLVTALSSGLLGGCLGGGKPAPPDFFYQLGAPSGAARIAGTSTDPRVESIVVRDLRSDGLRQERALLYSRDPAGLAMERFHYDFWADSPPDLIKTYLVRSLREAGLARRISGDPVGRRPDLEIGGRLLHFEQIRAPERPTEILVELELQVEDTNDGRMILFDSYRERTALKDDRMARVAAGFRDALDRIVERFAADLRQRLDYPDPPGGHASR